MKAILMTLLLSGCAAIVPQQPDRARVDMPPPAPFTSCLPPPPEPPPPRTVEDIAGYVRKLELSRRDCAERLRLTIEAYEAIRRGYAVYR